MSRTAEIDVLRELLAEGFKPAMIIRTPKDAEIRERLPAPYWGKEVKALPLARSDGEKRMFYYITPETHDLAQRLVAEQSTIKGYAVCVYCSAIGLDAVHGRTVEFTAVIDKLCATKGWDVRTSQYPNVFEVHFQIDGDDKEKVRVCIEEVEVVALALSIRNRLGFHIEEHSCHPLFVGQPLNIVLGLPVRMNSIVEQTDLDEIVGLKPNTPQFFAARALRDIYSQVSPRLQLIVGWAALEDLFSKKPEHLLAKGQVNELVALLNDHSTLSLDAEGRNRIEGIIRNPNLLAKQNRNERLAATVSRLTGDNQDSLYIQIREISRSRGALAHSLNAEPEVTTHIEFIEKVLLSLFRSNVVDANGNS